MQIEFYTFICIYRCDEKCGQINVDDKFVTKKESKKKPVYVNIS